jgi:predicted Zn-dependent protease
MPPAGDDEPTIAVMRRNHLRELRADRRGAEMLERIGVPPQAMTRMLLKVTSVGNGDYSGSHPAIEVRLENLGFVPSQLPRLE